MIDNGELKSKLAHYRISGSEYEKICNLLGREPVSVEWALFSALWSEHCSYKSSRLHLKKFGQTITDKVVNAAGENAGVVDLGFGERIVFKMESHNHPSFIEPYQGAATGVGGILRDIFTMGARPIASADFLCFGDPEAPRMKALVNGVVRGISGYGNCVGVPTVTGYTEFHSDYNSNILVNAMSVGLLRSGEQVALSQAKGPGNLVVYVGAKTGKDGVHGAAMASESFDLDSDAKKPNVQIGDPYFEKLLIESCLEVLQQDLVVAIQDMGAAGLTSSSFEMASKGGVGMTLHLDQVPLRDLTMNPEEILLSESQERMLLVCEPKNLQSLQKIFSKWGLDAVSVGKIETDKKVKLFWKNELLTSIDPDLLVENAPIYERSYEAWKFGNQQSKDYGTDLALESNNPVQALENLLNSPMGTSRTSIFRQYDQRVGALTAAGCEASVAFLRLPDSGRGLAIAVGCRPQLMRMDARIGALDAVLYPSLQMAIKGAKPVAITDCLNFGNPEKNEIMSEFVASVDAIVEASLALGAPVVSGNVSFYNETLGKGITSTPAIGLIGLRDDVDNLPKDTFQAEGNFVYKFDLPMVKHNSSKYTGEIYPQKANDFINFCLNINKQRNGKSAVASSRIVGRGGLMFALVRHSLSGFGIVCEPGLSINDLLEQVLYSAIFEIDFETQSQVQEILQQAEVLGIQWRKIGRVQRDLMSLSSEISELSNLSIVDLQKRYESGFLSFMKG